MYGWGRMFAGTRPTPYSFEPWGFDNGAYVAWKSGQPFPESKFLRRLEIAMKVPMDPIIAVCPDQVTEGIKSLEFSLQWIGRLPNEWPWYLAVQDGMDHDSVADVIHLFSGIFLGGSDKFKFTAYGWSKLAHMAGKKFHYGRAGTLRKLRHAHAVDSDSCDSAFPLWTSERMEIFHREYLAIKNKEQLEFSYAR